MRVSVILHSFLRDLLPPEAKGQVELDLPEGARVQDVVDRLKLPAYTLFALNERMEKDRSLPLKDGDALRFLRAGAGG